MISQTRKVDAEDGILHQTARKLGALFQGMLPSTPSLFKAYGKRVSEISEIPTINPRPSEKDGIFANQIGADATSIWAAVTSGEGAIATHLLACMLSRIFSSSEATSIWVELVSKRKEQICRESSDAMYAYKHDADILAAKQDLARMDLGNWDASARAWVQSADQAKALQHKQLMLILQNAGIPVNNESDTYTSVTKAWTAALQAMENLLQGIPQRVPDGAVLLGLSAWHMYPDMIVLGATTQDVRQKDPLFLDTAILTLGLEINGSPNHQSVSWSLPLACLQYYGHPVRTTRFMSQDSSRTSMEKFTYVVLGCIFSKWREFASSVEQGFSWLLDIQTLIEQSTVQTASFPEPHTFSTLWFKGLCDAAQRFADYDEVDQRLARQLIALGRRKAKYLYSSRDLVYPLFGLSELSNLIPMMSSDNVRVQFLRKFALQHNINNTSSYIIRYTPDSGYNNRTTLYEYASVCPVTDTPSLLKRNRGGQLKTSSTTAASHRRWLSVCLPELTGVGKDQSQKFSCSSHECMSRLDNRNLSQEVCRDFRHFPFWKRQQFIENSGESCLPVLDIAHTLVVGHNLRFSKEKDCNKALEDLKRTTGSLTYIAHLGFVAGNAETAAIFRLNIDNNNIPEVRITAAPPPEMNVLQPYHMEGVLTPNVVNSQKVIETFFGYSQVGSETWGLKAYGAALQIYKLLPDATVSISVIKQPLLASKWIPKEAFIEPSLSLSRPQVFACISMFDSGTCDLDPSALQEVFAMSSGNSIYVSGALLCDPHEKTTTTEVRRVVGNVGRAGISLMIAPPEPKVREAEIENYMLINHLPFQGHAQDSFRSTSVHLSFTAYVMPLVTQNENRHIIDRPASLIETLISTYDQRTWVADLDIIKALSARAKQYNEGLRRLVCKKRCNLSPFGDLVKRLQDIPDWHPETLMTSIDNWDELLDPPQSGISVVRAQGNWLARLAITAVCSHLGFFTIIIPKEPCWSCCGDEIVSRLREFSLSEQEPRIALIW
jgi:hypothetical protein